jgi:hypothetical protein
MVHGEFSPGANRDSLQLTIPAWAATAATVDLRMFGRSQAEQFKTDPDGTLTWRGWVNSDKRYAESVLVVDCVDERGGRWLEPAYVDCGATTRPEEPSTLALDPADFPRPQTDPRNSGGLVLEAVGRRHGRPIDAADSEAAADWMESAKGLHRHFLWRGGAERQMAASRLPLVETEGDTVQQADVDNVMQTWRGHQ